MNIDPFRNGSTQPGLTTASPSGVSRPSKSSSSTRSHPSRQAEDRGLAASTRHVCDAFSQVNCNTKKNLVGKEKDLPELCIVGIHPEDGTGVINDLAHRVMNGSPLRHGQRLGDVLDSFDVIAVEGPATGIIQPTIALHKYGPGAVRLQQIVWPDPDGRFPWDDGYNMPPAYQPVIANPGQTPPAAEHLLLTIDERRLLGPADWANAAALIQTWGPQVKVCVNIDVRQLLVHGLSALTPRQVAELADRLVILPADITF